MLKLFCLDWFQRYTWGKHLILLNPSKFCPKRCLIWFDSNRKQRHYDNRFSLRFFLDFCSKWNMRPNFHDEREKGFQTNKQTKKQTKRPKIDSQCFSLKLFYEKIFSNSKAIVSNRNPFASLLLTSQRINLNRRSQSTKSVSLRKIKVK